jgi:hypothetical protein
MNDQRHVAAALEMQADDLSMSVANLMRER